MEKVMFSILFCLLLSLVSLNGCIEEISQIEVSKTIEKPKTVYIDDDYDYSISGWGFDHFNNIQDGINNVSEKGIVYVYIGIYYENIVINKSITMIGEDNVSTIIKSGKNGDVINIAFDNCTIQNMNISNSSQHAGVKILANRTTLSNNILHGNYYGILINSRSFNTISKNIISSSKIGISLKDSYKTNITENQISSNNLDCIILDSSYNSTISDNIFQNNGITISGSLAAWNTHIIENNTANEKYIYYYKNKNGITIPNDAIQVILANCSDFVIENINFENLINTIQIGFSSNVKIESNYFESNIESAIFLFYSDINTITSNTINGGEGIDIIESDHNIIFQNTIENTITAIKMSRSSFNNISENNIFSNNNCGMLIQSFSNNNTISRNNIYGNQLGIRLKGSKNNIIYKNEFNNNSAKGLYICCASKNNIIYYNSFIQNVRHVDYTVSYANYFYNDGFGNHWDDYIDRYPSAKQLNGVWDTPYKILESNFEDIYPLVEPVNI
jgi:parallel beta-helix repeat protein